MERYRTPIVALAAIAGVALISVIVFASAATPAYACTEEWVPGPTASPAVGSSPNPGYVQPDLGTQHEVVGSKVTYTYCPPASGSHFNASGLGPIQARLYAPSDRPAPEGWIHNLEHGGMVILYRGDEGDPGITEAGQAELRTLYDTFPNSPICGIRPGVSGPVIARFDEMATPFAALVWGRVLPLDTLDTTQVFDFWSAWGDRTSPERPCEPPSVAPVAPSVAPGASPSPS